MTDEKEKKAFIELKRRMEGEMESDLYEDDNVFYRFLRARDFKIDAAESMLRNHLEWRKKYDVKNAMNYKIPEVLEKYCPLVHLGYTKDGCVLRYIPGGAHDYRGLMASCNIEEWTKHLIKIYEEDAMNLKMQSKKLGKVVDKTVFIQNMEGLTWSKVTDRKVLSHLQPLSNMQQDHYPESMKATYCVNVPSFIGYIFILLKRILPSQVIKKFRMYSDDSWKKDLLEIVDAEVLPAFLGGTRTDPDGNPLCNTFVNHGGIVPEEYKIRDKRSFSLLPDLQRTVIARGGVHETDFEVKEPGSLLKWSISVTSGDIKFGITYRNNDETKIEILPLRRINTDDYVETGSHTCERTGTYVIVFDNTYSWVRSKEIYFRIEVETPEENMKVEMAN